MNQSQNYRMCFVRHGYFPEDIRVLKDVRVVEKLGFYVDVICLKGSDEKFVEKIGKVTIYRIPLNHQRTNRLRYIIEYGLSFLIMFFLLNLLFLKKKYKIIQVHTLPDFLVFITFIPKLLGTKIIIDMHEPTPELWQTKYCYPIDSIIFKILCYIEQLAMRFADHVLTVNETIKRRFIERGTPSKKITIIRNVPDEFIFKNSPLKITNNKFTIITHGTIEPRYGHDLLLKAMVEIKKEIQKVKLIIIGRGHYIDKIKQQINDLGLEKDVNIFPWVSIFKLPQLLCEADVGIVPLMPTPFSELCQPNKLFDYIVLKKPVVVSRLPAIEENYDDSSVYFFQPGDYLDLANRIFEIYNNQDEALQKVNKAFNIYQELKWEKNKEEYLKVVES